MERSPDDITSDELSSPCVCFSVYRMCRQVCVIPASADLCVCTHVGKMEKMIAAPEYLFQVAIVACVCASVSVCELFWCTQAIQSRKKKGDRDDTWAGRQS